MDRTTTSGGKYVPPHRRNQTGGNSSSSTSTSSSTSEYHASTSWSPAQGELKQWLILGNYKKAKGGGVFVNKLKGLNGTPYYTIYFADAISLSGQSTVKRGIGINIHVNKTAGGAWISGITGCEVKMGEEPGVPADDIVAEWWEDVCNAYGK